MYDIIIIGSGPAGLTAAIYANRAGLKAVVIEKDAMGSGQIAATEQVDNYPGLLHIGGYELGEKFREHAEKTGAEFMENEVKSVTENNGVFTVSMTDDSELQSRAVIYSAGTSYRRLDAAGSELLGVSYCAVCDGAFYQHKKTAVIGGGDTALEDALYLSRIADVVYLIHRRDTFRANASLQKKVEQTENIVVIKNAVLTGIEGEKKVKAMNILHDGVPERIETDGIFAAIGSIPNTDILRGFVKLDANGYILADENGITSVSGFFAAGDVRTKSLRQVVTAVADGACCVASAEKYLLAGSDTAI